jgi:glycosyltransferase involved in cell wall biosynthesis
VSGPIRVLELRSVRGTGGGPEKTILLGAARSDPNRFRVTVCYIRDLRDTVFGIDRWASDVGVDYVEVRERNSFDPRAWSQLRRIVRERRIQIVHAHDYKTDLLALMLAASDGIVPLTTVHGWTGHSAMERRVYYPADKLLIRRFPKAIAVSGDIRSELQRWGCRRERVDVILNGIDHVKFRRDPSRVTGARAALGLADGEIAIGSVGRLEPQKRFDLLIEAFGSIRASMPRVRLFIAGEGSTRPALEVLIAERGLQHSCRLIGHTSDVAAFHHALDMFVQSSEYEGTPNVVLEAMAFETPTVATDVGGTAELVRDGRDGLIVPPRSVPRLVEAMQRVVSDPASAADRRASARRRVETVLSFDARMSALERIYEGLVGGSEPASTATPVHRVSLGA